MFEVILWLQCVCTFKLVYESVGMGFSFYKWECIDLNEIGLDSGS